MSEQWLHDWFPGVGMLLQVLLWGQIIPVKWPWLVDYL